MNEELDKINKINLDLRCPVCHQGNLYMIYKVTKIPYFGGIVTMTIRCDKCSLKISDVIAISNKGDLPTQQKRLTFKNNMGDLIVLSAGSKIEIPEIGIEVYVSSESGGEITTIEGVLLDIKDKVISLMRNASKEDKAVLSGILKKITNELRDPSGKLSVVVTDENQRSAIIPNELWAKRAEKEREAMSVKISTEEIKRTGKKVIKDYLNR